MKSFNLFIFILLCLGFSLFACAPPRIWETEEEEFRQNLYSGRYNFLRHIDYEETEITEIHRLGKGAGFYMHYVFLELDMLDLALEMLKQEWFHGEGLLKQEAGKLLISRLIETEKYDEARREALLYIQDYPASYAGARLLLEAVYWKRDSAEVLRQIEKLEKVFPDEIARDPEIVLFRAVSKSRLKLPGWPADFITLFTAVRASGYHIRAFRYIDEAPALIGAFHEDERRFLNAKMWFATENYSNAADEYTRLLENGNDLLRTPVMIVEAGEAYLRTERYREGERAIAAYIDAAEAPPALVYASLFTRGLLLRKAEAYDEAVGMFRQARNAASGHPLKEDRCLWYELDCRYKRGLDDFLEALESASKTWHEPSYFSDLVERAGADMVGQRRWGDVWETYLILKQRGDPEAAGRYGYISFRAAEEGLFRLPETFDDRILEEIAEPAGFGYYQLLARIRLGKRPAIFTGDTDDAADTTEKDPGTAADGEAGGGEAESNEFDLFVKGFFRFSLHDRAFYFMKKYGNELGTNTLLDCAARFSDRGLFRESIIAANAARGRLLDENWDVKLPILLFPKAYIHEIKREAKKNDILWYILAALVREESYFDPHAVSRAGAVGLAQLMPATAQDMERRLNMENSNIFDPATNLVIGAYYFGTLLKRFDGSPSKAVFAYNAGPTRMRRWEGRYLGLPGDLFLEAIPIEETRNHGRKVLVSALVYGYIYEGEELPAIVSHYFADRNYEK